MGIGDRLNLALQSEMGVLLLALVAFVGVLGAFYFFLSQKKKKSDALAYRYQAHFDEAEEKLGEFEFTSPHKPTLFGRETIGKSGENYGLCRIAPPPLSTTAIRDRFSNFFRVTKGQELLVFAPYTLFDAPVTVQGGLIDREGRRKPTAWELIKDQFLNQAQVEEVLLEITKAMSALHALSAENGGALYHGLLIPQNVYVGLDPQKKVREVVVADAGIAFSLGPKSLYSRLEALKKGKITIEKYTAQQFLEQMALLAPEQREEERLHEVGPAADFYAFAALALALFGRDRFTPDAINWEPVPLKWRPFLERCLKEAPGERPKDFMEITDWLFDPELALTRHEGAHKEIKAAETEELPQADLSDLGAMLSKIQKAKGDQKQQAPEEAARFLAKAQSALTQSKWAVATAFFRKAEESAPHHPEVLLGLAISQYEQGALKEAEEYHNKLNEIDPNIGKRFHEHLACKR